MAAGGGYGQGRLASVNIYHVRISTILEQQPDYSLVAICGGTKEWRVSARSVVYVSTSIQKPFDNSLVTSYSSPR
jgi:hypothetical protein